MKSIAFLLLSFLLLTLGTKSSIANQELGLPAPVYDTDGDILRAATKYHIVTSIWPGGGLTVGKAPQNKPGCPLDVIQLFGEFVPRGRPVIFTPVNSTKKAINVSTDLNIKFAPGSDPPCVTSTEWRVEKSSNPEKQLSVRIDGGVLGNPSSNIVANKFQIEKIDSLLNIYKLTYCPTEICRDISNYSEDDGTTSLVINGNQGSEWVFEKADSDSIKLINAE